MILRVYKILANTKTEGPGNRFCIWVQGCSKHCKGCYAHETWDFNGGYPLDTDEIIKMILLEKSKIEGVTFLGGEPFEQAHALFLIAKACRENNLSVLCFTGKTYIEIKSANNKDYNSLLSCVDLLIDGEFIEEKYDLKRPWVGSSNQNYIFLTDRYNLNDISKYKNKIEIHIYDDGKLFINGMGDFSKIEKQLSLKKIKL